MARPITAKAKSGESNPFRLRELSEAAREAETLVHLIKKGVRCGTDKRGQATPGNGSPTRIVVDASGGFIPLWAKGATLHWRFQERSMRYFEDPDAAKAEIEELFGEALLKWGDARPVKFAKRDEEWDFEVVMSSSDDC